ncbi:Helicase associated domain protein [Kitasatospora sp. NPDC006697]|uniref:Helicase associated domain protein n=1 Tax=Kitasatospora sp. NPDC006697 TaxID=3364020 RepID=UPI0036A5A016
MKTTRRSSLALDGHVDWPSLPEETVFEGEPLGRWLREQRAGFAELADDQRDLLLVLGIDEDPGLAAEKAAAAAKPTRTRADRFGQHLAALAQYVAREGHAKVPRPHKEQLETVVTGAGGQEAVEGAETVHIGLGVWLNNMKSRRAAGKAAARRGAGRATPVRAGRAGDGTALSVDGEWQELARGCCGSFPHLVGLLGVGSVQVGPGGPAGGFVMPWGHW